MRPWRRSRPRSSSCRTPSPIRSSPASRCTRGGPAPESAVIAIAGALNRTSALLKLGEASPQALAFAAYMPEGQDAQRMVIDVGRRFGLKVGPQVAARVADQCGNDQAIVAQELQ